MHISFLEIYDSLENNLICGIESQTDKEMIDIFNQLYHKTFKNIYQLSNFLWFEIGKFTPTKIVLGYENKIGCNKDIKKARNLLNTYFLKIEG